MISSRNILKNARRIAVVRTDRLGDMVLTLPMCAALKAACPNAEISLITRSYCEALLYNSPAIDHALFADRIIGGVSALIRSGNYDGIFFPRPQFDEYFAAFSARIPLRVGSGYRWYSFLINHKQYDHRKTAESHEAEYNTRLVVSALDDSVETHLVRPVIMPESKQSIEIILSSHGISSDLQPIIIHPGSGGSSRDWSPENFGKLASIFTKQHDTPIIITGIDSEQSLCETVHNHCPTALNLCGKLNLPEMIALLDISSLLVANSTGVLHVAAALGTPVVGLYPRSPAISARRWGPYSTNSTVISPPDTAELQDDMSLISVESVADACFSYFIQ
ncbi:MAG: glycosyltransferase family 9 protein [Bacteroidetes bacterium]|nr:glycosyltransferase family 9 protein [Bacteroidota bacterium]